MATTYPAQARLGNRLQAFRLGYIAAGVHAWLDARSGIARSGAARSNYYDKQNVVLVIGGNNLSAFIKFGSMNIRQAINDEPDTASFTLLPDAPFAPHVGDIVEIGLGAVSNLEFAGRVMTVQHRRESGRRKPFFNVFCHDWLADFDQRLVSYAWPRQSATTTILDLIARYCQHQAGVTFDTTAVVSGLPELAAFSVVNARPSEVMRRLTNLCDGGGFYIAPDRNVHAWAGTYAPGANDPNALHLDLFTLKSFAHTDEGAQARTMLVVEGARTEALAGLPDTPGGWIAIGIPVADATAWRGQLPCEARIGSQRVMFESSVSPALDPTKARQTTITSVNATNPDVWICAVADGSIFVIGMNGWLRLGDQYANFGFDGSLYILKPSQGWGGIASGPVVGATITRVDSIAGVSGTTVIAGGGATRTPIQAQPPGTEIVVVVRKPTAVTQPWPPKNIEHLVSDGRYSYAGAAERATTELANFETIDVTAEWLTDDPNARPGREQRVTLDAPDPLFRSFLILSSDITFPGANLSPRRHCTGGMVKRSNILDILLTSKD